MKEANEIREELRSMGSILADLPRTMPFVVPAGYFNTLAGTLRTGINAFNEAEQVPNWSKEMPYVVPVGYFEELTNSITAKAFATSLPKATPFAVPEGYFNTLPQQMLQAAKASEEAKEIPKVISLKPNYLVRSLRWAAAAILVAGIGLGTYQYLLKPQEVDTDKMLASIPANELQDYVQGMYRIDVDRIVSSNNISTMQLDNKDIIEYLDETGWD